MAPSAISSLALAKDGCVVVTDPQLSGTPASAQVVTMRSASSRVWHMGFSVTMPLAPHSTARHVRSARSLTFVHTATMSGRSVRSISAASV